MKAFLRKNTGIGLDEKEQSLLNEWEKVATRITSRRGKSNKKDLEEIAHDWRQLANLANQLADQVDEVRRNDI